MHGLYAVVDLDTLDARALDPIAFARAVIEGGATALQLRAKHQDGRRVLSLLVELVPICHERSVLLVANDRADLALVAGCDAVHVGQTDLPPGPIAELARRAGRHLSIGLSTHDEDQADRAAREPVDYIAVGPVASTATKKHADPVLGIARARTIASRIRAASSLPVVAIGGIDAAAAAQLAGAFDMIAVVGALLPPPGEPMSAATARARAIVQAFTAERRAGATLEGGT
jgi:thiamine-phosphate pyrophosphorylase